MCDSHYKVLVKIQPKNRNRKIATRSQNTSMVVLIVPLISINDGVFYVPFKALLGYIRTATSEEMK